MKSAILYRTTKQISRELGYGPQELFCPDGSKILVRIEVCDMDVGGALNSAKPREGESVINTLPLE